jgi:hypothetical protein
MYIYLQIAVRIENCLLLVVVDVEDVAKVLLQRKKEVLNLVAFQESDLQGRNTV